MGLGGKATITNRGTSLKGFVKYGERLVYFRIQNAVVSLHKIRFLFVSTLDPFVYSFADIKVKLKNRGNDPYKGDLYGDSICIEHRISSDGCRTCKIKNKTGNIMTSSQITGNIGNRTFSYI